MKFTMKLLILVFGMLMLTNIGYAESPVEQLLNQMVEQLQKNPTDNALREKIIKLAQTINPAPAVPEEAERRMMRGAAALEDINSVADYQNAAKEFELATLAAPWYGDAYFNLGVAQDKAENYEAALRSLKFALLASPDDKDIKALIFKVEYRKERESSPEVQAAKRKQQELEERRAEEEMMRGLDGAEFFRSSSEFDQSHFLRVRGGRVEHVEKQSQNRFCLCGADKAEATNNASCRGPIGEEMVCESILITGRVTQRNNNIMTRYEISEDGREIQKIFSTDGGRTWDRFSYVRR
jgi:tetratricopeptide (TPR) repeat protein